MSLVDVLARRRVALGFVAAAVVLVFAQPTLLAWVGGFAVAVVGEALRFWAAGHLEKSREVTRSGPYRWMRHPLYAGSAIVALGAVVASRSLAVAVIVTIYMVSTLVAAVRAEEALLERAFGNTYARYRRSSAEPMMRRFSLARAWRNREYRAAAGLVLGFGLLALKLVLTV